VKELFRTYLSGFFSQRFLLLSAQRGMEIDAVVLAIDAEID